MMEEEPKAKKSEADMPSIQGSIKNDPHHEDKQPELQKSRTGNENELTEGHGTKNEFFQGQIV